MRHYPVAADSAHPPDTAGDRTASPFEPFRDALFAIILLVVWISTKPFGAITTANPGENAPDIVNQLTFASLGLAAIAALLMTDRRMLMPLLQPSWLLMLLWLLVSVGVSAGPGDALRALAFTLIVVLLAATLYALPRDADRFRVLLFGATAAVLAFAWAGVLVVPDLAIHSDADPFEPEHAGSWRGHITHKNIAGAMMAIITFIGIYALRSGRRVLGLVIVIGAVTFLYFTRSKTSMMLLPAVLAIGFLAEWLRSTPLRLALCIGPVISLNILTLGSALSSGIAAWNRGMLKDPTFTGRLDIWRFGFEKLAERPWFGFGYESFWLSDLIRNAESKLELSWTVQGIIHGHNSYLDVMLAMGIPGLVLVVWIFVLKPVWDYTRCQPGKENRQLATACLMIWLFVSLCSCLEVFYFRRADPIWFALLLAVFGLRMTASLPLATPSRQTGAA